MDDVTRLKKKLKGKLKKTEKSKKDWYVFYSTNAIVVCIALVIPAQRKGDIPLLTAPG